VSLLIKKKANKKTIIKSQKREFRSHIGNCIFGKVKLEKQINQELTRIQFILSFQVRLIYVKNNSKED
jgi:hypothetical protein